MAEEVPPHGAWHDIKSLHFKLFYYKVLPCTKAWSHDWQHCPFTHPNDKARRRSPLHYSYSADMCPAMLQNGACPKGVNCNMAHNLFEYHLHPDRYKTKMCREGARCSRIFCFFAHSQEELRTPFSAAAKPPSVAAVAAAAGGNGPAGSSNSSSSTATNTPVNQPATPSVSSASSAGAGMHGVAQQQFVGAACRSSLDQQQSQQLLLQPAAGMFSGSGSISSCGTAVQAPITACSSGSISGGSCILLLPSGTDNSYSQQQQQQQPGVAHGGGVLTACQPGSAGMPMHIQYIDGLNNNQQQQTFAAAAAWQQGSLPANFVTNTDQVVMSSMGQTLLQVSTQPQVQLVNAMPATAALNGAAWTPSAVAADSCSAAMGGPITATAQQQQAQHISWPSSAAVTASAPGVGVSAAVGTLDIQYAAQQPAAGRMLLQPAAVASAGDAAAAAGQQLQLLVQNDSAGASTVMVGQQRAVLVPLTLVNAGNAPVLGGVAGATTVAVQQQGMPQQQALLVPLSASAPAAAAPAVSNMVISQWAL